MKASGADTHQDQGRLHQEHDVGVGSLDALDGVSAVGYEGDEGLHDSSQTDHHVLLPVKAEYRLPGLAQHEDVFVLPSEHIQTPLFNLGAALRILEPLLLLLVRTDYNCF